MANKIDVYEFDPQIYPVRLWVGVNPDFSDIADKFYGLDDKLNRIDINEQSCFHDRFTIARTSTVCDKKTGWIGVLVEIYKPKSCKIGNLSHEAAHCADFICEYLGITHKGFDDGEAYAYLLQWIVNCCEKVKKGKV